MQDLFLALSVILLAVPLLALAALAALLPAPRRIAARSLRHAGKTAASVVLALSITCAVIFTSLALGDSIRGTMDSAAQANMGTVDAALQSPGLFGEHIAAALQNDSKFSAIADGIAPLLALTASVHNPDSGEYSGNAAIMGYDGNFTRFGSFYGGGGPMAPAIAPGEVVINSALAQDLEAGAGSMLNFSVHNPDLSIDSLFSLKSGQASTTLTVKAVVDMRELGRFQFGTSAAPKNAFVPLKTLQGIMNADGKINTVLLKKSPRYSGSSDGMMRQARDITDAAVGAADLGLVWETSSHLRIDSRNIFFPQELLGRAENASRSSPACAALSPLCTYFVEGIGLGDRLVAYSTVAGFDSARDAPFGPFYKNITGEQTYGQIGDNEAAITDFTAAWIHASVGSKITIKYQTVDSAYAVHNASRQFTVKYIVNLTGKAADAGMPPYPGIKGRSCDLWDPPLFKMNSSLIFNDSYFGNPGFDYWQKYGGAPKAYISLGAARQMWGNDLGEYTTVKVKPVPGYTVQACAAQFLSALNASLTGADAGIAVGDPRGTALESSAGVEILTETFASFGAVVVASGAIVAAFFIFSAVDARRRDIGIEMAVGLKRGGVAAGLAIEYGALAVFASAAGLAVGAGASWASVRLINGSLSNIIESPVSLQLSPATALAAFSVSLFVNFIIIAICCLLLSRVEIMKALRSRPGASGWTGMPRVRALAVALAFFFCAAVAVAAAWRASALNLLPPLYTFFGAGLAAVLLLCAAAAILPGSGGTAGGAGRFPALSLGAANISRRRKGAYANIAVTALVAFTLLSLAFYDSSIEGNLDDAAKKQGGGYDIYAETSQPVMFDISSVPARASNGVFGYPAGLSCVQFLTYGASGGTCTNLRKSLPPRLIAMNDTYLSGNSIPFYSGGAHAVSDRAGIWAEFSAPRADGRIPAIGDYNTVVWILQKAPGDTVSIADEKGAARELAIAAIMENTVFQGSVFIPHWAMKELYPTKAQYTVFLFKAERGASATAAASGLEKAFSAYGMDTQRVRDMALANMRVDSAYLRIFQALLFASLLIGAAGVGIMAMRGVRERRYEIGVLRALGLRKGLVSRVVLSEYMLLICAGMAIGAGASVAMALALSSLAIAGGWMPLAALACVLAASAVAVAVPARRAAAMQPADALRVEE